MTKPAEEKMTLGPKFEKIRQEEADKVALKAAAGFAAGAYLADRLTDWAKRK